MKREFLDVVATGFFLIAGAFSCAMFEISCTPLQAKNAENTALNAVLMACVIENSLLAEKDLQLACGYADELAPIVRQLISAQKAAMKAGGGYCIDAGKE